MEKDSKYAFRVNREVKNKFKMYCRVAGVSPSDILTDVMVEFNENVDKIIQMKDIEELKMMIEGKFMAVSNEVESYRRDKIDN